MNPLDSSRRLGPLNTEDIPSHAKDVVENRGLIPEAQI